MHFIVDKITPFISVSAQKPQLSGRDDVDCMATRYGLDGPGIESRWGEGSEIYRT